MFASSPCWFLVPGEICICWCGRWPCEVCSSHCSHHLSSTVSRQILTEGENQPLGATIAGGAVIDLGGPQHRHQRWPTCLLHPPLSPLLKHWIFISPLLGKSLHDLYSANLGKVHLQWRIYYSMQNGSLNTASRRAIGMLVRKDPGSKLWLRTAGHHEAG